MSRLNKIGDAIGSVAVIAQHGRWRPKDFILKADAFVVACGSYSAPLLRTVGVDLAHLTPARAAAPPSRCSKPEGAPMVSTIDDGKKIAMSRLGNVLRVAGTIELGGFDTEPDSPGPRLLPHAVAPHCRNPAGVCDTRTPEEGGNPQYWTACVPPRPPTSPSSASTCVGKLWVNAGHGTLAGRTARARQGHGRAAERRSARDELRLLGVQAPRAVRGTVTA